MVRRSLIVLLVPAGFALAAAIPRASAQVPGVDIAKVGGVIDPAVSAYVTDILEDAERDGSTVVLQIDSAGTYGDEALTLARRIRGSTVPVVAWVGPAGATAQGGALFLLYASALSSMAPGAGIGPSRPFDLSTTADREDPVDAAAARRELDALARGSGASADGIGLLLQGQALPAGPALERGAVAAVAPRLPGEPGALGLLREIDGREVRTATGSVTLVTLPTAERPVDIRFHDLGPVRRVLHAVATPTAFYLLVILGLWGIAFEITQPGFGVAGIAGLLFLSLAGYSLTIIPVGWLGLALILAGTGLQALDVVIRRVGLLTAVGTMAFATGSLLAWRDVAPAVDLSTWLIGFAAVAGLLFFGFGMTVALKARERVRSSQVGLVGLVGEARADLDPEGAVYVKGTLWRARSNDGFIPKGRRIRVRGVDGLILRVEEEPE